MMFYTTAINAVFAVLIAAALFFTADGVTNTFLLNLLFYIIITPIITVTLTKIMFSSENEMIVSDAMTRIDSILNMQPLPEPVKAQSPKDNSVELEKVSFHYPDAKVNALNGVNLCIAPGAHIALVGPSGGERQRLSIARAFLKDAPIILLDEATLALGLYFLVLSFYWPATSCLI